MTRSTRRAGTIRTDRRTILALSGAALAGAAGCLGDDGEPPAGADGNEPDGSDDDGTGDRGGSRDGNADDGDGPGDGDRSDGPRTDPVFVENAAGEAATVDVRIQREPDGVTILENAYEVPPGVGLEIPDVGEEGSEYVIEAAHDGRTESREWTVLSCDRDGVDEEESTAGGVRVADAEFWVGVTDCDETGAGDDRDLRYEDHEEHVIDE